jgi:predicted metal-dependent phosphoesterase TrpH
MTPTFTIDLHMHTYYSDGKYSPEELLRYAASIGLETIAITDHDNTNGAREALPLALELGIQLIPAVEFTCHWSQCEAPPGHGDIDVLGYFVDLSSPEFQAFEQATLNDIHMRIDDCCSRLTAAGYPISLDDVFAENQYYAGILHLAFAVRRKGYADSWDPAFRLVVEYWKQVRLSHFTIQQVIEQIHLAGGVAILAHPATVKCGGHWLQANQLAPLVEMGLDGLEIYHHRLDEQAQAYFLALSKQFGLLVSGGSDEHGWSTGLKRMGSQPITAEMLESLRARHLERIKQRRRTYDHL